MSKFIILANNFFQPKIYKLKKKIKKNRKTKTDKPSKFQKPKF